MFRKQRLKYLILFLSLKLLKAHYLMDGGGNARAPPLALDEEAVESVLQSSLGSPEAEACQRECTELGLCCVAVLNVLPSASGAPLIMEQLTPSKPRQRCVNMHAWIVCISCSLFCPLK